MSAAAAAVVFLLAQLGEARLLHSRSAVARSVKRLHLLFISLTTCQRQPAKNRGWLVFELYYVC